MYMKIEKIILWPKDITKKKRIIKFKLDKINVITGISQTGKSAIIPIIDYCLGSEKCAIPVGKIRDKTEWFGILLRLKNSQLLIARREPGNQQQAGQMYYMKDGQVVIPEILEKNSNVESVKHQLNELAGLSYLNFEGEEAVANKFKSRPSFRDLSAFEFQPQHIVANPYTLYFKADTYEHREKLKTIFPYVLGVIDNRILRLRRELKDLEKELKYKLDEMERRKRSDEIWKSKLRGYYSKAIEYGLLEENQTYVNWESDQFIEQLKNIPKNIDSKGTPKLKVGNTERAVAEIVGLKDEENDISHAISVRRFKLEKLERLVFAEYGYANALEIQLDRLESVGWFDKKVSESHVCPFCNSDNLSAREEIDQLLKLSKEINESSLNMNNAYSILDKEIVEIKKEIRELEKHMNIVRTHRKLLEDKETNIRKEIQTEREIYKFIGKLEYAFDNLYNLQVDSTLIHEIKELESTIELIEKDIDEKAIKAKTYKAIHEIQKLISKYTNVIGVERPDDPVQLDIKNLTVKIMSSVNKGDFLWEIGSGANWMGYHIVTLLALHEYFLKLEKSPVPQFLVIDQPSQVYFPEAWPEDIEDNNSTDEKEMLLKEKSDDILRTQKIFQTISKSFKNTSKELQIIIVDHVGDLAWEGIEDIYRLEERWDGKRALLPIEWLKED